MAKLYVFGTVEMIEDEKFLNIIIREDDENVFRLGVNSKNRNNIKIPNMGDVVIIDGIARSKKKENGFFNMDGWIHSIKNITAEFVGNKKLSDAVKDDAEKTANEQKDDDIPW